MYKISGSHTEWILQLSKFNYIFLVGHACIYWELGCKNKNISQIDQETAHQVTHNNVILDIFSKLYF